MMPTKLEECARAACKAKGYDPDAPLPISREPVWLAYRCVARAVIRCLMEPSQAMIDAADDCDGSTAYDVPAHGVTHLRAMLQSVLDEAGKE